MTNTEKELKKVLKDGIWFWPEMECGCGAIGCYDLTTDIGCRPCLIARGKIATVSSQNDMPSITFYDASVVAGLQRQLQETQAKLEEATRAAAAYEAILPQEVMVETEFGLRKVKISTSHLDALLQAARQDEREKLDFVINNYAFIMEQTADTGRPTYQLWTQIEDEEYIILHDKDKFFPTKLEAVEAAMLSAAPEISEVER